MAARLKYSVDLSTPIFFYSCVETNYYKGAIIIYRFIGQGHLACKNPAFLDPIKMSGQYISFSPILYKLIEIANDFRFCV